MRRARVVGRFNLFAIDAVITNVQLGALDHQLVGRREDIQALDHPNILCYLNSSISFYNKNESTWKSVQRGNRVFCSSLTAAINEPCSVYNFS